MRRFTLSILALCVLSLDAAAQTSARPAPAAAKPPAATAGRPPASAGSAMLKLSAYERLDQIRLADALSALGSVKLLTTLADELEASSPADALYARGEATLCQAKALPRDSQQFLPLIDQAAAQLEKAAALLDKPPDERALLKLYRVRLRLADVQAVVATGPNIERLLFLQGGEDDRKMVLERTEKPLAALSLLHDRVRELLQSWRDKSKAAVMVTLGPSLAELDTLVSYKLGYARLCRGMAMDGSDAAARQRIFKEARDVVDKIAKDEGNDSGLKYWSMLLSAQASRETKEFDRAIGILQQAAEEEAETAVRVAANFEMVRCLIERGEFEPAKSAAEVFRKNVRAILGDSGAVSTDVQYALLRNYLFEQWATSVRAKDAAAADGYDKLAQEALIQFVTEHPEEQYAFFGLVATKYGKLAEAPDASPMILCALAISQRGKATSMPSEAETARTQETLAKIAASSDPRAETVRPLAMFHLAVIYAEKKDALKASELFAQLASKYPTSPLAYSAVYNSVVSCNTIIQERIADRQFVRPNLRQDLAKAIELMLSQPQWAANPKSQEWYFSLAWQYDKLADQADAAGKPELIRKAIAAYQAVPPAQKSEYMEARQLALLNQVELIAALVDSDKTKQQALRREEAQKLVGPLQVFVDDAAKAAKESEAAGRKDEALKLREWAAMAEFQLGTTMQEYLDQKPAAQALLKAIPQKWPGTLAIRESSKYLIQSAVLENRTAEAITLVSDFRKAYPQDAPTLIRLVVNQLEEQIKLLRYDKSRAAELATYRQAYGSFAAILYEQQTKAAGDDAAMYPYRQLLANGKLEQGLAMAEAKNPDAAKLLAEALQLFIQCKAYDDGQRDVLARQIDGKFAQKLAEISQAASDISRLQTIAQEFLTRELPLYQVEERSFGPALTIRNCLKAGEDEASSTRLTTALSDGYKSLLKMLRKQLPIDPTNLWGLGRCYRATGQAAKAVEAYSTLIAGIDRNGKDSEIMYWQAELEYCQSTIEAYREGPQRQKACSNLSARIRQLQFDNPGTMGGLASQFSTLEAEASRLARQP